MAEGPIKDNSDMPDEEDQGKYKNLLIVISAIGMIIVFASMLMKATKLGSFGLLLLIVILMMMSQFSGILEKIFSSDARADLTRNRLRRGV